MEESSNSQQKDMSRKSHDDIHYNRKIQGSSDGCDQINAIQNLESSQGATDNVEFGNTDTAKGGTMEVSNFTFRIKGIVPLSLSNHNIGNAKSVQIPGKEVILGDETDDYSTDKVNKIVDAYAKVHFTTNRNIETNVSEN